MGSWLGMQTLAAYAVILTLSTLPTSLILRVFGGIGVSTLLQKKDGKASVLAERYGLLTFFSSLIGAGYALTVALTLDWLTPLVFGPSYQVAQGAHVILVAIVYLRVLRGTAPTMFFLVTGKTGELAILNSDLGYWDCDRVLASTLLVKFGDSIVRFAHWRSSGTYRHGLRVICEKSGSANAFACGSHDVGDQCGNNCRSYGVEAGVQLGGAHRGLFVGALRYRRSARGRGLYPEEYRTGFPAKGTAGRQLAVAACGTISALFRWRRCVGLTRSWKLEQAAVDEAANRPLPGSRAAALLRGLAVGRHRV